MAKKASKTKTLAQPSKPYILKRTNSRGKAKLAELPKHKPTVVAEVEPGAARPRISPVWKLARQAVSVVWRNKKIFLGIGAVYAVLSLLVVQTLAGSLNISGLRDLLANSTDRITSGLIAYQWLLNGPGGDGNTTKSILEAIILLAVSLATVWALRQFAFGHTIRIRDAYYKGMYPIVPVILILLLLAVQLVPLLVGVGALNLLIGLSLAPHWFQMLLWSLPAIGLAILSFYLVTPTIISAYIATLPDMEPRAALQSGRELVRYRRWTVLRKLLFVPIALLLLAIIILVPVLLLVPLAAPWVFFLFTIFLVPLVHAYNYMLYRELIA